MEHMRAFPTAKTTNYVFPISHRKVKDAAGVLEILYTCGGDVLEASTSNVFIVKDGAIRTPKDDVLIGITRNLVLRLAGELGIGTSEGAITSEEFFSADEAFLTASNKRVVPVVRADGNPIGGGSAGPVTNRLHGAISGFMEAY
jgi:branched-subunit amino acid aminotransferase/4-amino-4-deoxychorismate lyase